MSHDVPHHNEISLIVVQLSERESEAAVVFDGEEKTAFKFVWAIITTTSSINELLDALLLLVIYCSGFLDLIHS